MRLGTLERFGDRTVLNSTIMGCIDDAKVGSDVIQFKRAVSNPLTVSTNDNYFIVSNVSEAEIFTGTAIPIISNSQLWEYQHRIYYIREEAQGNNTVPVLMQGRLTTQMTFDPIIDGIEMIRFMYGIDTDAPTDLGTALLILFFPQTI